MPPNCAARPVSQRRDRPPVTRARKPGSAARRLDPHPGHVAVEQHVVVDNGLAVQ